MNDLITMSIQGGRYLEAEKQLGDIIISDPSPDAYFMLGTTKSNLLLDSGRNYLEVQFCFNKYIELAEDKSEAERNIMAFSVGLYAQLSEIEKNLVQQRKNEAASAVLGAVLTFASSKIIDNSTKSFGVISGMVGASYGIGMATSGLSNLGSITDMISYVSSLKLDMIDCLKNVISNEKELLSTEILTLSEKYGSIAQTDNSVDISLLESLGSHFIQPKQAILMTKDRPKNFWNVKGTFKNKDFEIPSDDPVLGGFSSLYKDGVMEFLFTKKGVYGAVNSKFTLYKDVKFKKNLLTIVSINGSMTNCFRGIIKEQNKIMETLNLFVEEMKK